MIYLIDGYNLLFRLGKSKQPLEKRRTDLIFELNQIVSNLNLQVIIVFDGVQSYDSHAIRHHFDAIEIVYTPDHETADEYIVKRVSEIDKLTVITSDRNLASQCRHLGAQVGSIENFVSDLKESTVKKKKKERPLPSFSDSPHQIKRYLEIFEKRLSGGD